MVASSSSCKAKQRELSNGDGDDFLSADSHSDSGAGAREKFNGSRFLTVDLVGVDSCGVGETSEKCVISEVKK